MLRTVFFLSMFVIAFLTINQLIVLRRYQRERIEKIVTGRHDFTDM